MRIHGFEYLVVSLILWSNSVLGKKNCLSLSQRRCRSPFYYGGVSYNICTVDNSDRPPFAWCYYGYLAGEWDYCPQRCFECGSSNDVTNSCGMKEEGKLGGMDRRQAPWHTYFVTKYNGQITCSGALLSNRHVITTTSCATLLSEESHEIIIGSNNVRTFHEAQRSRIKTIILHKDHKLYPNTNDVALVVAKDIFVFNDRVISACKPSSGEKDYEKVMTFSGPYFVSRHVPNDILGYALLKINDSKEKECLDETKFCTKKLGIDQTQNLGSPLMKCVEESCVLTGLLSYPHSPQSNYLVFTNVGALYEWIEDGLTRV